MNCMYGDGSGAMIKEEIIRDILAETIDDDVVNDIIDQLVEMFYDSSELDPTEVIYEAKKLIDIG